MEQIDFHDAVHWIAGNISIDGVTDVKRRSFTMRNIIKSIHSAILGLALGLFVALLRML